MKMKYQRGGRSGKLHNMAMRIRKNKPQRFNPLQEELLKKQFIEQMKLLAQQNNLQIPTETIDNVSDTTETTIEPDFEVKEQINESRTA